MPCLIVVYPVSVTMQQYYLFYYKQYIERQFWFFRITDPATKKDGLLINGGEDLVDINDALLYPTGQAGDNKYRF